MALPGGETNASTAARSPGGLRTAPIPWSFAGRTAHSKAEAPGIVLPHLHRTAAWLARVAGTVQDPAAATTRTARLGRQRSINTEQEESRILEHGVAHVSGLLVVVNQRLP